MFVVTLSLCCITKSCNTAATSSDAKQEVRRNVESNRVGTSPTSENGHMRSQSWFKLADLCTVLTNARASLIKVHVLLNLGLVLHFEIFGVYWIAIVPASPLH